MGKPKVANEPLHSTAHITFNTSQSKFMAKVYKSEMKMLGIGYVPIKSASLRGVGWALTKVSPPSTEKEQKRKKPQASQRPCNALPPLEPELFFMKELVKREVAGSVQTLRTGMRLFR